MEKNALDWIAIILVVVDGLNWGLVGLFNFNLATAILGSFPPVEKVIYMLVGLAAIYTICLATKD